MLGRPVPFDVTVYDKNYARKGPLGSPVSLSGEAVFNGAGSLEFTVPADHPRILDLIEPGARVTVGYRPTDDAEAFPLISGRVSEESGTGTLSPTKTFAVTDDWTVLSDEVQCWPNPTGTIGQQGDEDAYFTVRGPAETVLKDILSPNVTRQGTALTIPASQGRGSTITGQMRFHTVEERLFPALEDAGLGVRVLQVGDERVLDVFEPATFPRVLTQESGVVASGEYSVSAPLVTRVLIAAGGEGTARVVRQKVLSALEAEHGVVLPAFRDARDVNNDEGNLEDELEERMNETLAEGAPKASLKCELAETGWFRFGVSFNVGDRVSVQLAGAPVITDVVRAVAFEWSPDAGVKVTPRVGEWSDTADAVLIDRVASLSRAISNLEKR